MSLTLLEYVPIVDKTLAHWQQVETKTARPLFLKDKTTRADLAAVKDRLQTVHTANLTESNNRQRAQETRDSAVAVLHPLVKQARTTVKGLLERVPGAAALPKSLPTTSDPQKYLQAARDIAEIWTTVNALSPATNPDLGLPLTIPILDGETTVSVTLAQYNAAVAAYATAVDALTAAKTAELLGRKTRDIVHKLVRAKLIAYPTAAKARLAVGDPLRDTIPTVSEA